MFIELLKYFLAKYIYQDWNVAIADVADDLTPINIKWVKHNYKDRWFADPFIIDESENAYIVLVEEFLHSTRLGRLARLTIAKSDFSITKNETILDLPTHLSFPNYLVDAEQIYLYPENGESGDTKYYKYGNVLEYEGILSEEPLADATIAQMHDKFYLFATVGKDCNGNRLQVYSSDRPLGGYTKTQEIEFPDNIARRAGNVFQWNGKLISPAQICNEDYGQGVSLQEVSVENGIVEMKEIKRMYPLTKEYPEGFHTYNVWKDKVIIDGYRYGSKFLHNLYFKIRS